MKKAFAVVLAALIFLTSCSNADGTRSDTDNSQKTAIMFKDLWILQRRLL